MLWYEGMRTVALGTELSSDSDPLQTETSEGLVSASLEALIWEISESGLEALAGLIIFFRVDL